jgi:hypothetical protein
LVALTSQSAFRIRTLRSEFGRERRPRACIRRTGSTAPVLAAFVLVLGVFGADVWAEPDAAVEPPGFSGPLDGQHVDVLAATQPARAQGTAGEADENQPGLTVRLDLRPVEDASDPLFAAARRALVPQRRPPASLKSPVPVPSGMRCCVAQLGGQQLLALIDRAVPPRVAVDTDLDGNLLRERLQLAKPIKDRDAVGGLPRLSYGPIRCSLAAGAIEIVIERDAQGRFWVLPGAYREGSIGLAGRDYRVALVDCDYDGRYDRAICTDDRPLGGWLTDWMAIDRNRDGRFDVAYSGRWEIQPLTPVWAVGESLFRAKVEPDGSVVRLEPAGLGMGLLDVGTPDSELLVVGLSGVMRLTGGEGKWWLPEGPYSCWSVRLRYTEAATKRTWTLADAGNPRDLRGFEIEKDQTLSRPIGGPLKVTRPAWGGASVEQDRVTPESSVVDQAGIAYRVIERDGQRVGQPPGMALARVWTDQAVRLRYGEYPRRIVFRRPMRFG